MKIQIDTEQKIIKIEKKTNLKELFDMLDKFFKNKEWHEYDIDTTSTINWTPSPIIIERNRPLITWEYPWYTISYDGNTTNNIEQGVFDVEVKD